MDLVNQIRTHSLFRLTLLKNNAGQPAANYKDFEFIRKTMLPLQIKLPVSKLLQCKERVELAMGQRWFDLQRWGGSVMAAELKAYVDFENNIFLNLLPHLI